MQKLKEQLEDKDDFFYQEDDREPPNQIPPVKTQLKKEKKKKKERKKSQNKVQKCMIFLQVFESDEKQKKELAYADQSAIDLIMRMKQVYEKDKVSLKKGKPAIFKHKFLDNLKLTLNNVTIFYKNKIKTQFLQNDGLLEIEKWLEKRADGTEPPINMKKDLFELIYNLPIEVNHIRKSGMLSEILQRNRKSPFKEIEELASKVVNRWKRIRTQDYGKFESFYQYIRFTEIQQAKRRKKLKRGI